MSTAKSPPHQASSMTGARWPGSATEPMASAVWAARASGVATALSTLRSHTGGSPSVTCCSQVVRVAATAVLEGGSERARTRGRARASSL